MACSEMFSIYGPGITQIYPFRATTIEQVVQKMRERNGSWEQKTKEYHRMIREGVDKKILEQYKRTEFSYATFSGVFTKRDNKCLKKHSGLICLDFDHVENLEQKFKGICDDKRLEARLVFHSPSGDGIKVVAPMPPNPALQDKVFASYARYFRENFSMIADDKAKDLARACFLPWDDKLFINQLNK